MGFVSNIEKDDETGEGFRKTKDEFGKGIREPCHTQPTGSTVPDPLQSPDPEMTIRESRTIYTRLQKILASRGRSEAETYHSCSRWNRTNLEIPLPSR